MNKIDVISQIEVELTWREEELNFMKNQLSLIKKEIDKSRYRKSLVVMLYSYYEGFCKAAFLIYIKMINSQSLKREEVNLFIRTSSLNETFLSYGNDSQKDKRFKKELPDDNKLHKYARQIVFVKEFNNFLSEEVYIPDSIIDTESNLKPVVLKKMLFRLGFPFDELDISEGTINKLLNIRNHISHGSKREGILEEDYEELEVSVKKMMSSIKTVITNAILNDLYLEST